jgi:hypothetical protein
MSYYGGNAKPMTPEAMEAYNTYMSTRQGGGQSSVQDLYSALGMSANPPSVPSGNTGNGMLGFQSPIANMPSVNQFTQMNLASPTGLSSGALPQLNVGGAANPNNSANMFTGFGDAIGSAAGAVGSFLQGPYGQIIGGLGEAAAQNEIIKDIRGLKEDVTTGIFGENYQVPEGGLIGEIGRQVEFKPFTVSTPSGSRATVTEGGMETALSPAEQELQSKLLGFGGSAFDFLNDPEARAAEQGQIIGMLTQDPAQRAGREQDIYNRMLEAQRPEQERQRMALEERLASQGRLGVTTNQYGGTPEALALEKAIAEQQAGLGVSAMEQARLEQAQESSQTLSGLGETRARLGMLGELGLSAIPTSYAGQDQILKSLAPQLDALRINAALKGTGLGIGAGLAESGIDANVQLEGLANSLRALQFKGLFDLARGEQATEAAKASQPIVNTGALPSTVPSGGGFSIF